MQKVLTHGSLFSGSGGFDEAARMNGIKSLWCSEIEPFPLRVLKKNFPEAEQLGDISQIDGAKITPVDIISGGSPCQNMSIAGNREGLDGDRSVLFHEQIRIVKEMRKKTDGKYPRFMVWENVPGAFSSNKGEDFRCVLEEIVRIAEPGVSIPRPPKGGKWSYAGAIMGDGYSVAWRTFDAQYWGVPQRRRRIYLVADFGGGCAPKILFECKSLSWNPTQSRIQRQGTAGDFGEGSPLTDQEGRAIPIENHPNDSRVGICEDGKCQTLTGRMGTGGGNVPLLLEQVGQQETPKVLRMRSGCEGGGKGPLIQDDKAGTITCNNDQVLFAFGLSSKDSNAMKSSNPNSGFYEAETSRTLDCKGGNPTCNQGGIVIVQEQKTYAMQSFGEYKESDKASTLKERDYKDSTDLVVFEPGSASRIGGHIYKDGKTGTLRANPGDNQQAVAIPIEGNGQRPSHKGDGWNESDKSYTLNATEQHGVAYGIDRAAFNQGQNAQFGITIEEEKEPTLVAKGPNAVAHQSIIERVIEYIVRRLTPMECARLQGFPDDWTDDLAEERPSAGEMRYWVQVWLDHWAVIGRPKGIKKPKTEKQVKKWLATEPSDSDKYKLWGNGIALPCAFYVFEGIREVLDSQEAE